MIVEQLLPSEIDKYWEVCRAILSKAFRDRLQVHSVDDYPELLKTGNLQLCVVKEGANVLAAIVTSIDAGTNAKVLSVLSLAGEQLPLWIDLVGRHLTDFANFHECNGIEYVGRKGFTHFLPDYEEDGRVYVKILR